METWPPTLGMRKAAGGALVLFAKSLTEPSIYLGKVHRQVTDTAGVFAYGDSPVLSGGPEFSSWSVTLTAWRNL